VPVCEGLDYTPKEARYNKHGKAMTQVVHGINDITAIELEEWPTLGAWVTMCKEGLTRRPSASQVFSMNAIWAI